MDGFLGLEVIGFGYGSLLVNNELRFKDATTAKVVSDVKDRIDAAAEYFRYAHVDLDKDATEILQR